MPASKQTIAGNGTCYKLIGVTGPVVVLIHGLGLNQAMWWKQADALSSQYRLLVYDLIGSGQSARPQETPTLSMFAKQLAELLDELGIEKAAVAGFSIGGMIARRFAMDNPDRLWALVILNSAYKRDAGAHQAIQNRVYQAQTGGPEATVEAALSRWFTDAYRDANLSVMNWVRTTILANDKEVYPQIYQVLVDGVNELVEPQPPIACPTLVMTAEEDYGNSVEMMYRIAGEIPDSKTVVLPGLRHMAMVEAPDLFNKELLEFLNLHNLEQTDV